MTAAIQPELRGRPEETAIFLTPIISHPERC
jgi:hypothetical protein